ncbi:MAG: anti-sigma-factor antagonist [Solirubrobacterales bacterium]|nr:anti-sigma-factor antagonist [Solirubrobacterales bacterium]
MAEPADTERPEELRRLPPPPPGLIVEVAESGDAFRIAPRGEIDMANVELLASAIQHAERSASATLVVDLGAVGFIDSCGLQEIVALHRRALMTKRRLLLVPGPPAVQRVFEICGLSGVLNFIE